MAGTILDKIIEKKRQEVQQQKQVFPLSRLQQSAHFHRQVISLEAALLGRNSTGIIAEYKRQSPSKGIINDKATVQDVVKQYEKGGAAAVSVLTDGHFFGGSLQHLMQARQVLNIPLLRKEFIIDEYQIYEAKASGADVVLLIAACLSPAQVQDLAACARSLGLEVLLELHSADELDHVCTDVSVVGVNNRNLKDFKVDLAHSILLAKQIKKTKVAESGIDDVATVHRLQDAGFHGFLMGERFMREENPGAAFVEFARDLKRDV